MIPVLIFPVNGLTASGTFVLEVSCLFILSWIGYRLYLINRVKRIKKYYILLLFIPIGGLLYALHIHQLYEKSLRQITTFIQSEPDLSLDVQEEMVFLEKVHIYQYDHVLIYVEALKRKEDYPRALEVLDRSIEFSRNIHDKNSFGQMYSSLIK